MTTTDNVNYTADDGKVFADAAGNILGKGLSLGSSDSIENYTEIDTPEDYVDPEEELRKEQEAQREAERAEREAAKSSQKIKYKEASE